MEQTLDRRWVLPGAGAAGAAMVGGLALTASAQADEEHRGVEGGWLITHQDDPGGDPTPVKAVSTFAAGGAFLSVDIARPDLPGPAHGRRSDRGGSRQRSGPAPAARRLASRG